MRGKDGQNGVKTHQNLPFFTLAVSFQIWGACKTTYFLNSGYFLFLQNPKTLQWIQNLILYLLDWTSESSCCLLLISFLNWGAAFLSKGDCHRLQQLWHCIWCFCWTGHFKIIHFCSTNSAIKSWLGYLIWASALLRKPSITKVPKAMAFFRTPPFRKPSFSKSVVFWCT